MRQMSTPQIADALSGQIGYFISDVAERVACALGNKSGRAAQRILLRSLSDGDYTDEYRAILRRKILAADTPVDAYVAVVTTDSDWAGQSVAAPWADAIEIAAGHLQRPRDNH